MSWLETWAMLQVVIPAVWFTIFILMIAWLGISSSWRDK